MKGPSAEQAQQLAVLLFHGVSAGDAIPYIATDVDAAFWPELVKTWPHTKAVMDAHVVLQGVAWTELTTEQKVNLALEQWNKKEAWLLMRDHPMDMKAEAYARAEKAAGRLEKVKAGTAGKFDPSADFFEKFSKAFEVQKKTVARPPAGIQ